MGVLTYARASTTSATRRLERSAHLSGRSRRTAPGQRPAAERLHPARPEVRREDRSRQGAHAALINTMRAPLRAILACGVFVLSGCDSDVSIPGNGGSGGSRGGQGPVAAGGVGGAGGSLGPIPCGTLGSCDFSSWCDYPTDGCTGDGVCVAIPTECPADCGGVCSCDGAFYCNECLAHKAGVDVDALGDCATPDIEYSAHPVPTSVPRLVLFKADFGRDVCIQVKLAGIPGPGSFAVEVTPVDWQIEGIVASDHVTDCQIGNNAFPVPPQGQTVLPLSAGGTLALSLPAYPCGVSSDMMLQFPAGLDWVDELEAFQWEYRSSQVLCSK